MRSQTTSLPQGQGHSRPENGARLQCRGIIAITGRVDGRLDSCWGVIYGGTTTPANHPVRLRLDRSHLPRRPAPVNTSASSLRAVVSGDPPSIYHGRVGAGGRRRRLPAARPPAGLRARPLPRRHRRAGDGDRGQLHQVHGHRRLPAGRRRRPRALRQVGRQARRRPRLRRRLLPRRRHRRVREVHEGDDDPAVDGRAVLGQGDGELRRVLEGHRRVHGRRGRRRRQVQGGLRAPQLRPRRLHTLHPLPRRRPHRRLLQGLLGAGVRRRGHRELPALRGRAGVHHRRARGVAGGQAQPGHQGRRAAEGGRPRRRRAGRGARVGFCVNERASVTDGLCGWWCPW